MAPSNLHKKCFLLKQEQQSGGGSVFQLSQRVPILVFTNIAITHKHIQSVYYKLERLL